ncbi:MAG: phenylacetate--CoA ligase family protein [Chitinispirillaceae bacterium]|nr:phenylacetate--CoA ligase family protein [Chitinispirillaceae bacterium]
MIYESNIECIDSFSLKVLQAARFRRMVKLHTEHIPIYRQRIVEAYGSSCIESLSDVELLNGLSRIRPVYRDEYQFINTTLLRALDRKMFFIDSSSGSTGSPKSRFCSVEDDLHDTALCTRAFASFGIEHTDRVLTFDLADLTYYSQFTKAMQGLGVKNSFYYSARSDFESSMCDALAFNPTTLIIMPSILKRCYNSFVDYCKHAPHFRRLIYFGEPLEQDIRADLLENYSVHCFSMYGSTDVGWIAAECAAHAGMHLFSDSVILHLLSDSQTGSSMQEGAALFTSLFQTGKPNLRYSNGDRIRIDTKKCSCGRTTPRVSVACRDTDLFVLLGTKISIMEIQKVIFNVNMVSGYFQVELTEEENVTHFSVRLPRHLECEQNRIFDGLENKIGLAFYTCIGVVKITLDFVNSDFFTGKKIPRLVDRRSTSL